MLYEIKDNLLVIYLWDDIAYIPFYHISHFTKSSKSSLNIFLDCHPYQYCVETDRVFVSENDEIDRRQFASVDRQVEEIKNLEKLLIDIINK